MLFASCYTQIALCNFSVQIALFKCELLRARIFCSTVCAVVLRRRSACRSWRVLRARCFMQAALREFCVQDINLCKLLLGSALRKCLCARCFAQVAIFCGNARLRERLARLLYSHITRAALSRTLGPQAGSPPPKQTQLSQLSSANSSSNAPRNAHSSPLNSPRPLTIEIVSHQTTFEALTALLSTTLASLSIEMSRQTTFATLLYES